ncbi:TolC family protein [Chlorobium phaeobacteroides]|uniref:TolC family protein n=1 Tax=Chlorobium phaeobacteroides TaxID=1096 RepID=UPI0000535425|nr:TolC family protein [Chlorobium phaeobacteroides]
MAYPLEIARSQRFSSTKRYTVSLLTIRLVFIFCIASLLFFTPSESNALEPVDKKVSLDECIAIALENASTTKKAENSLRLQGADILRSYGNFLPKISASASYIPYSLSRSYTDLTGSANQTKKIKTKSETIDLTLTTSLNIFNGFRDYASLQAALKREDAGRFSLSRAKQAIVFDVTQAYYQVLLNQEILAITRENLLSTKDQLTLTDRQFQIGLKSMIDLYQQQAEAANSELSVIQAENQLERSRLELLRRLRIDPLTRLTLAPVPKNLFTTLPENIDINALIAAGLEKRPDLKGAELETRAAKWQITQYRGALYPKFDLNFNISTSGTESLSRSIGGDTIDYSYPPLLDQLENLTGYSVVLSMNWAIFDGFQTRYAIEQAKINYLNQRLDYDDLKSDIQIELQQAASEYSAARKSIESAKTNLKAARAAYEGIKRKYDLGAAGFVELSTSRAALFSAMSSLSQATYTLALQKNTLDFATGNVPIY